MQMKTVGTTQAQAAGSAPLYTDACLLCTVTRPGHVYRNIPPSMLTALLPSNTYTSTLKNAMEMDESQKHTNLHHKQVNDHNTHKIVAYCLSENLQSHRHNLLQCL